MFDSFWTVEEHVCHLQYELCRLHTASDKICRGLTSVPGSACMWGRHGCSTVDSSLWELVCTWACFQVLLFLQDGVSSRKSSFAARSTKLAASVYKPRAPPVTGKRQKASQSKPSTTTTRSKQPSSSTSRRTVSSSQRTAKTTGMSITSTSQGLCSQAKRSEARELKAKSLPELPQLVPTQSQKQLPSHIRSESKDVAGTEHETSSPLVQQATKKSLTKIAFHDEHKESGSEPAQDKSDRFSIHLYG